MFDILPMADEKQYTSAPINGFPKIDDGYVFSIYHKIGKEKKPENNQLCITLQPTASSKMNRQAELKNVDNECYLHFDENYYIRSSQNEDKTEWNIEVYNQQSQRVQAVEIPKSSPDKCNINLKISLNGVYVSVIGARIVKGVRGGYHCEVDFQTFKINQHHNYEKNAEEKQAEEPEEEKKPKNKSKQKGKGHKK